MPNTDKDQIAFARIDIDKMYVIIMETRDNVRDMKAAQLQSRRIWGWLGGGTGLLSITMSLTAFANAVGG